MALNNLMAMVCSPPIVSLTGTAAGFTQVVRIEEAALRHFTRFRQLSRWATEAGGQLFGSIDATAITVARATGPYRSDERSRYRYRSDPVSAQRSIDAQQRLGRLYLGEWHTHAEDHPSASGLDDDAMHRLIANSKLNSSGLLLVIVGRADAPAGLALASVSSSNTVSWSLAASPATMT